VEGVSPRKWLNLSDAPFLSGFFGEFSGFRVSEFLGFYIGDRFPEFGREGGVVVKKYINRSVFDKIRQR
jgi:hypothetical protein